MGLTGTATARDRKRSETRDRLLAAAWRLFAERGFDAVSMAQIGSAAGLSTRTVTSYFPAKEALYFDDAPPVDDRLPEAVRDRPPGESAYEAVRFAIRAGERFPGLGRAVRERPKGETVYEAIERYRSRPLPAAPEAAAEASARARIYLDSEHLRGYVDGRFAVQERILAEILATDTGAAPGDPLPGVAAAALLAPLRWVFTAGQHLLAAGDPPDEVARDRGRRLDSAYALLGASLAGYARRPRQRTGPDESAPPR